MTVFLCLLVAFALIPARLVRANLRAYRPPPEPSPGRPAPRISVLIPARNEESSIGAAVSAVLASRDVELEVLVLDDRSEDATAEVVGAIAQADSRVRLIRGPELPPGWCGKQHACWVLAGQASHPLLVFLDADVRLAPDALVRMAAFLDASGSDLASGFPRQETVGLLEKLVIPLMHFILLGFLPIRRMRRSSDPTFAAGCGQLFITTHEAYRRSGGHTSIRGSLHDGIKLPRAYRLAGLHTDLFDATDLAACRMYRSAGEVWRGLAKNAGEALAAPRMIVPMTVILLGGQVVPFVVLAAELAAGPARWNLAMLAGALAAAAASWYSRWMLAFRFGQSRLGAFLHPVGIVVLVAIQWYAWARDLSGQPSSWKGRLYRAPGALDLDQSG
ncbi:MAG: glycosyltransferase family 2 protein [Isosphaeraceae bacterium]